MEKAYLDVLLIIQMTLQKAQTLMASQKHRYLEGPGIDGNSLFTHFILIYDVFDRFWHRQESPYTSLSMEIKQKHSPDEKSNKQTTSKCQCPEARCCLCSSGQVTWSLDGCKVCQDEARRGFSLGEIQDLPPQW